MLVFVVVLLSLLAILGTAYLATSRTDRQTIRNNGRGITPFTLTPRLSDREKLDEIARGASARLQNVLIEDLFNLQPGFLMGKQEAAALTPDDRDHIFTTFRQQRWATSSPDLGGSAIPFYENYDAPGRADPWLASLLPTHPAVGDYRWPWISAPITGEPRSGSVVFGAGPAREVARGMDLEPFFADPRTLTKQGFSSVGQWAEQTGRSPSLADRHDVQINSVPMLRRSDANAPPTPNTRVYPGFRLSSGGKLVIAGDADGDGIADAGLIPIALDPNATGSERYVDVRNGVVYFVGYRIIDNSAQLNLGTALTVQGDLSSASRFRISASDAEGMEGAVANPEIRNALAFETKASPNVGFADAPNFGFFRTNVGLLELFREMLRPSTAPGDANMAASAEALKLIDARFPLANLNPPADADGEKLRYLARIGDPNNTAATDVAVPALVLGNRDDTTTATAPAVPFQYRSFGDLIEQQLLRRAPAQGDVLWRPAATGPLSVMSSGLVELPVSDAASLQRKGGALLAAGTTPSTAEAALLMTLQMAAPNFTTGAEPAWQWFPPTPTGVQLWYDWTKSFAPDLSGNPSAPSTTYGSIGLLDARADADERVFVFKATSGDGMTDSRLPKSVRTLLTSFNGVTANTPQRRDKSDFAGANGLPKGMPNYGPTVTAYQYPASRVSAATGTKEQLWRAYWSAMTQSIGPPPANPKMMWSTLR